MVSKMLKRLIGIATAVATISSMAVTAFADEPYETYSYDNWQDPIPSQAGYMVEKTWTGHDLGLDELSNPESEFFISNNENPNLNGACDIYVEDTTRTIWIADTENHRILSFNENFELKGCYKSIDGAGVKNFNAPKGLFVEVNAEGDTILYVADTENSRGVRLKITGPLTCELQQEFLKPDSQAYSAEAFTPSKVSADKEGNVYLIATSVNTGALRYDKNGEFKGFFGANRVEQTAEVIARKVWRIFASEEQLEAMVSTVPTEFHNFDMDQDGFIFTVTESANASTDAVKKLNPAGVNIWNNAKGNTYQFGDFAWGYDESVAKSTKLTDVVVGENEVFNLLDYETGRVFQYDKNADLLFVFGTRSTPSEQEGSFTAPNAVETLGDKIYVIDGIKNDVTVFVETVFGKYVHAASILNVEGKYTEAKPIWEEVIRRDGGYTMAHIALGKAALNAGEYKLAMEYFETAYDQENYDKAYEYYRDEFLRANFEIIVIGLFVLIVLILVYGKLKKKKIIAPISAYIAVGFMKIKESLKKKPKKEEE
ncbi:MAG: hypothetical protein IJX42_07575 [Oscillospiraceae bacterium]|nr:hypothetical protein [Oscillospiraceae bacterium]